MKILILLYFCFQINSIYSNVNSFINSALTIFKSPLDNGEFNREIKNLFQQNLSDMLDDTKYEDYKISVGCIKIFNESYFNDKDKSSIYFYKFYRDSSFNKNDVGSYTNCRYNTYFSTLKRNSILENVTYLIYEVNKSDLEKTDFRYGNGLYIGGLCVVDGCNDEDYKELIYRAHYKYENFLGKINLKNSISILSNMNNDRKQEMRESVAVILVNLIPLYIFCMQILFMIFPKIPLHLFRCCFKMEKKTPDSLIDKNSIMVNTIKFTNRDEENSISSNKKSINSILEKSKISIRRKTINKNKLFKFKSGFDYTESGEQLFSNKSSNEINNESGLAYVRGIIAVSMILMVIGKVFRMLFLSPVKIYNHLIFENIISDWYFSVFYVGLRYAPSLLLSCSGFTLAYKLLFYLDNQINELNDKEKSATSSLEVPCDGEENVNNMQRKIPFKSLFNFIFSQFYKYLIYILIIFFFKYSFYYIGVIDGSEPGPILIYMKKKFIDQFKLNTMLGHVFLYENFRTEEVGILHLFWLPINEICSFTLCSILIFLAYKYNFRLDIFNIFLTFSLIGFKFSYKYIFDIEKFYPTLFYYYDFNTIFHISFFYNLNFYLIGIFFGKINYAIQKNLSLDDAWDNGKKYLLINIFIKKIFYGRSQCYFNLLRIFLIICILGLSFLYPIFIWLYEVSDNGLYTFKQFNESPFLNNFLLLDTEIFLILTHVICMSSFYMGFNYLSRLLSNASCAVLSRQYFCFSLIINLVVVFLFYASESRINFDFTSITIYYMASIAIMFFISSFFYVFVELPWKKINKLFAIKYKEN